MSDIDDIKSFKILMIENNHMDIHLIREALEDIESFNDVVLVEDGTLAIQYLHKEGIFKDALRPDLILLDLNLPGKDGIEVLDEIKTDDALKSIPVIILTTSKASKDIVRSYCCHANCYITKPAKLDGYINMMRSIKDFWKNTVTLPPK